MKNRPDFTFQKKYLHVIKVTPRSNAFHQENIVAQILKKHTAS